MLLCTCERESEQESDMALQATTADTSCCHSNRLLKFLFILDGGVRLNTPVCAFPPTPRCVTRLHLNRVDVANRLHTDWQQPRKKRWLLLSTQSWINSIAAGWGCLSCHCRRPMCESERCQDGHYFVTHHCGLHPPKPTRQGFTGAGLMWLCLKNEGLGTGKTLEIGDQREQSKWQRAQMNVFEWKWREKGTPTFDDDLMPLSLLLKHSNAGVGLEHH